MTQQSTDLGKVASEGISQCRQGNWSSGLRYLRFVADSGLDQVENPALVCSYLGYGLAVKQAHYKDGLELCQRAVSLEFYEPLHYFHLASIYALRQRIPEAFAAINKGLAIDPNHRRLRRLRKQIDRRRRPVLRFLGAKHPLNRSLGKIRHRTLDGLEALDVLGEGWIRNRLGHLLHWFSELRNKGGR